MQHGDREAWERALKFESEQALNACVVHFPSCNSAVLCRTLLQLGAACCTCHGTMKTPEIQLSRKASGRK
jgi:hypothetical protein